MQQPLTSHISLKGKRYSITGDPLHTDDISIFYKATDHVFEREVTIRELFLADWRRNGSKVEYDDKKKASAYIERFQSQARLLANVRRSLGLQAKSHIVEVFDCFKDTKTGTVYLVMEPLKSTLHEFWKKSQPSSGSALEYIRDIGASLIGLHSRRCRCCYQLVTPHSIWITEPQDNRRSSPEGEHAPEEASRAVQGEIQTVLVDFWLAEIIAPGEFTVGALQDQNNGTNGAQVFYEIDKLAKPFAAPEQLHSDRDSTGFRTDIYGLAATYYFLLTGDPPEVDESFDPSTKLSKFSPHLADVLRSALSKKPEERPSTVLEFIRKLDDYAYDQFQASNVASFAPEGIDNAAGGTEALDEALADPPQAGQPAAPGTGMPVVPEPSIPWLLPNPPHGRAFHICFACFSIFLVACAVLFQITTRRIVALGNPTPTPGATVVILATATSTSEPQEQATKTVLGATASLTSSPGASAMIPSVLPSLTSVSPIASPVESPSSTATSVPTAIVASRTPKPPPTVILTRNGFAHPAFERLWNRTDLPVVSGIRRPLFWGPAPDPAAPKWCYEEYKDAPDQSGLRIVQYFEKSRMELNDPTADQTSPFYVTNGLLAMEMITGKIQIGNNASKDVIQRQPATIAIVGDTLSDPTAPTYATLTKLVDRPSGNRKGLLVVDGLDKEGNVFADPSKFELGVEIVTYVPETRHNVPNKFWEFLNMRGTVETEHGEMVEEQLMMPWQYGVGLPITEPYWISATVGGKQRSVMIQAYQRRILTYVFDDPEQERVQMNNIGNHYYNWRYHDALCPQVP